ncbi:MAG: hypothetical protein KC444_10630 [Nitrosopumilus sp.]|nr:hypothetical protein [Nitrosopumilus sp.]
MASYHTYTMNGKERVDFHLISNKDDVEKGGRLGEVCKHCHWNSMGIPRKELE